jgi:hypothetical protein
MRHSKAAVNAEHFATAFECWQLVQGHGGLSSRSGTSVTSPNTWLHSQHAHQDVPAHAARPTPACASLPGMSCPANHHTL